MEFYTAYYRHPLPDELVQRLTAFWLQSGLTPDSNLDEIVIFYDVHDQIIATGSRRSNVLCMISVAPTQQGDGLAAQVVSLLVRRAATHGIKHLFIYTKPYNVTLFATLGFYLIASTAEIALLENDPHGLADHLAAISAMPCENITNTDKPVGAVVLNANPLTLGHLHLIHHAARRTSRLYLLLLAQNSSEFSFSERLALLQQETKTLSNVIICDTGDYIVSAATFPSYFLKNTNQAQIQAELDCLIFGKYFVPALGISQRFVGEEPLSPVTNIYNQTMAKILPKYGVNVEIISRLTRENDIISATTVRSLWHDGNLTDLARFVPPATLALLQQKKPQPIDPPPHHTCTD